MPTHFEPDEGACYGSKNTIKPIATQEYWNLEISF